MKLGFSCYQSYQTQINIFSNEINRLFYNLLSIQSYLRKHLLYEFSTLKKRNFQRAYVKKYISNIFSQKIF